MMEEAAVVVEAEQQRAHAAAAALVAEPADDTVGSAQMLDLEHGAFPRQVGEVQALRHRPRRPGRGGRRAILPLSAGRG